MKITTVEPNITFDGKKYTALFLHKGKYHYVGRSDDLEELREDLHNAYKYLQKQPKVKKIKKYDQCLPFFQENISFSDIQAKTGLQHHEIFKEYKKYLKK